MLRKQKGQRRQIATVKRSNMITYIQCTQTYISTGTTTVVVTGEGTLHTVTVQGGSAGTIIIYDNTAASGKIIASFDSTNAIATYTFDVAFRIGCTVITGAATKLTVATLSN